MSVTIEQCEQFVSIFDLNKSGSITREEFVIFVSFLLVMSFLHSTPEGAAVQHEIEVIEQEEQRIEDFISMVEEDRANVTKIIPRLQDKDLITFLQSDDFKENCRKKFQELDYEGKGF